MILTQSRMTERQYRGLDKDSSSTLKDFIDNRKKYVKKYVQGEPVQEEKEDDYSIKLGRIVETLMLEDEAAFDRKFTMSGCSKIPTGKMLLFCDALVKHSLRYRNEQGELTKTFSEIARLAYTDSGYGIAFNIVIDKFNREPVTYYRERLVESSGGKSIVTTREREFAQAIVNRVRQSPYISQFVTGARASHITVLNQLQINEFFIDDYPLKAMLDNVVINHQQKRAIVSDVKCTWNPPLFYKEYYLYRKTHIQAYLYNKALRQYLNNNGMGDYTIDPTGFIVCDSQNFYEPIYYQLSEQDMQDAYNGFTEGGKYYPGVKEIIEELKWCRQNNIWNMKRSHFENRGITSLK